MKLLFKALEKGITSTYILSEIKALLRKGVSDEDLIAVVTKASASEKEQIATKCQATNKANRVYQVIASEDSTVSNLFSAVGNLTKQVALM